METTMSLGAGVLECSAQGLGLSNRVEGQGDF